jgi:TRAP-type mannitol/chloroaromatic compound transport system substrate-binding protein
MQRKTFFKSLAAGTLSLPILIKMLGGGEANAQTGGDQVVSGKVYNWKMVTTWPPGFPILGEGCQKLADLCREMSGGRLNITVYGAGEMVPALESFDAVSKGAAEMGSGAAYYWAGKAPAAQFFAGFPFGLNAQQMNSWLISGGGIELWRELYAKYNLVPFAGGNTGVQMGGWFNREITGPEDYRGLKMRMPGLGGRVLEAMGGTPVLLPGNELYTGLERGIIDATEWVGPFHDYVFGFQNIAKYYYYPGWHEPGTTFEFFVNKDKYEELPTDLQRILEVVTHYINIYTLSEMEAKNAEYLEKLQQEGEVTIAPMPKSVIDAARAAADEVITDYAASDEFAGRVYASIQEFRRKAGPWAKMTEERFYGDLS